MGKPQNLRWVVIFMVGALAGPLISAVFAGALTSPHNQMGFVYDGVSPVDKDVDRLIKVYSTYYDLPLLGFKKSYWSKFSQNQTTLIDIFSKFPCDTTITKPLPSLPGDQAEDITNMISGASLKSDVLARGDFAQELKRQTTPFARGFLASCLQSTLYRELCRSDAEDAFDRSANAIKGQLAVEQAQVYRSAGRTRCRYSEGLSSQ